MASMDTQFEKERRAKNIRTGLIVGGIAFLLFLSIILRTYYQRGG